MLNHNDPARQGQELSIDRDEIPVIVGPTASGKTQYAIALAHAIGAEIISADSMQIYRHLDIGTAKASPAEREGIAHHMIDIIEPDERFSVADYKRMAYDCMDDICKRGQRIVVTGGTGLYVSALIYNINYPGFSVDPGYREQLMLEARTHGNSLIYDKLKKVDPAAAAKIHANDQKRIIRALEVYRATGKTISEHERVSRAEPPKHKFNLIGLHVARGELYRRIDERVDRMLELGLLDEARALYERYGKSGTASQAIGYKEMFAHIDGECTLREAADRIKIGTRHYAKRQMTWFRAMRGITWIEPG